MILTYVYRKRGRSAALAICLLGWDDQMLSERAFETVDRDMPVTVDGKPDKSKTNTRLGYSLQRLFEPITAEQLDQLDHLLMLLDRSPSQDRK